MARQEHSAAFAGFGIPNIHISNIILESTGKTSTLENEIHNDPHVDFKDIMFPNVNHVLDATANKLNSLKLQTTLNLVFKDLIFEGEESWFENDDILDVYKIIVAQSTNPIVSSALMDPNIYYEAPKMFDRFSCAQGFAARTMSLLDIVNGNKNTLKSKITTKVLDDGTVTRELIASISFVVNNHDPKHLSYFLIPFLDISEFTGDTSIGPWSAYCNAIKTDKNLIGKPVAEIIIENYSSPKVGMIFYDQVNKPYNGPVHWMPAESPNESGYWMMGESSIDPNIYYRGSTIDGTLRAVAVANVKIQDFRLINKIDKINLDFRPIENSLIIIKDNLQNNSLPAIKKAHFTSMKLSRDSAGQARFFFGMDYHQLVRDNSAYPVLYDRATGPMVEKFLANSVIRSMKIKRRRVKETRSENQVLDSKSLIDYKEFEDTNEPAAEIIVDTGEKQTNTKSKNYFIGIAGYMKETGNMGSILGVKKLKKMGSLREVNLKLEQTPYHRSSTRHFTGIDFSIAEVTDGLYQYGVEVIIQDGSLIVLSEMVIKATRSIRRLERYLDAALMNHDPHTNTYSSKFKGLPSRNIESYKESARIGLEIIEEILLLIAKKTNMEGILAALYLAAHPKTGSPAGIEAMIRIVSTLKNKIEKLIASNFTTKSYKSSSKTSPRPSQTSTSKGRENLRLSKIEYYFSNVFDADVDKGVGYEFLSSPTHPFIYESSALGANGLLTLSKQQFDIRTEAEMKKIFTNETVNNAGSVTIDVNPKYTSGDTLQSTRYRFLAPSHVLLPNMENPFELLIYDNALFNRMKYAKLISDIVSYNQRGMALEDSKISVNSELVHFSEEEQILRRKLSDVFFARSCTIESPISAYEALLLQGVTGQTFVQQEKTDKPPIVGQLFGQKNDLSVEASKIDSPIDELAESYDTNLHKYLDILDPNSLLMTMLNIDNFDTHKRKASLLWYDLYSSDGLAAKFFEKIQQTNINPGAVSKIVGEKLKNAPNHIKFWFLAAAKFSEENVSTGSKLAKYNWSKDIMKDQRWQSIIWMNFKNLVELQVLTSYETNILTGNKSSPAMKAEVWKPIPADGLNLEGNYLCRMVLYEEELYNIRKVKDLELPIYHEYFMVKNGSIPASITLQIASIIPDLTAAMNKAATVGAASENIQTALIGAVPSPKAAKAKALLYKELKGVAETTNPLGMVKPKTPASQLQNIVGNSSVSIIQGAIEGTNTTDTGGKMGGDTSGIY